MGNTSSTFGLRFVVLLLMAEILHQLRLVVYPIIYKVLYIPGGARFQPSTVVYHRILPRIVTHTPKSEDNNVVDDLRIGQLQLREGYHQIWCYVYT